MSYVPQELSGATTVFRVPSLTTAFVAPSSCLAATNFWELTTGATSFFIKGPRSIESSCFPPSYTPTSTAFYSPGTCPVGYTAACSWSKVVETLTETHYTCCPSFTSTSFSCGAANSVQYPWQLSLGCISYFTVPITVPLVKTVGSTNVKHTPGAVTITPPPGGTGTINAFSVQIARQSGPTSMGTSGSKKHKADHSTAIGVGVGVGVGVLLLVIGAYLLWRRRKSKRAASERQNYEAGNSGIAAGPPGAASSIERSVSSPGVPKVSNTPVELSTAIEYAELSPDHRPGGILPGDARREPQPAVELMGDALPPGSTHIR
ncbi:hypothetical protein F5Y19DRAFT_476144 [Xylariaceae sp. FL1651]|nr:hypothetical protein F5Y19DRAFT_476144 [Xylariaceae sp. FL1651]